MNITTVTFTERTSDGKRWFVTVGIEQYIATQGETRRESKDNFEKVFCKLRNLDGLDRLPSAPRRILAFSC